jgi:Uma2 family endonuclease
MSSPAQTPPALPVPPLEAGQRLTRAEFERRYEAMPDRERAELIEGVVHMPSPVRHVQHGRPHALVVAWLLAYEAATPGVQGSNNPTVRLDEANEPEPDALLFIEPACGGQVRIDADGFIQGAPDLAVQVSASTVALDLGPRRQAYQRTGVREYLVCRIPDGQVDWFVRQPDQYERLPAHEGVYRSETFPGLWLDASGLLRGDLRAVLHALQDGLATPEHAAFVTELAQRRTAGHS